MNSRTVTSLVLLRAATSPVAAANEAVEANRLFERSFTAEQGYEEPFNEVVLDVVFTRPDGVERTCP